MSETYLTLLLEDSDIVFNQDMQLQLTNFDYLQQNYKVWLETQFESDFRDSTYGFKLYELLNTDYDNVSELLELYIIESLTKHPRTESIDNITITNLGNGTYTASIILTVNNYEEQITIGVEYQIE